MPASEPGRPAPNFAHRDLLIRRVESAATIAAGHDTLRAALDLSLRDLREESARTMMLIRDLRASPLYDRASAHPRFEPGW